MRLLIGSCSKICLFFSFVLFVCLFVLFVCLFVLLVESVAQIVCRLTTTRGTRAFVGKRKKCEVRHGYFDLSFDWLIGFVHFSLTNHKA